MACHKGSFKSFKTFFLAKKNSNTSEAGKTLNIVTLFAIAKKTFIIAKDRVTDCFSPLKNFKFIIILVKLTI